MKKTAFFILSAVFAVSNLICSSTSVAAGRKRPHVTKNKNVMVLEYDFEEPEIITEGDIDFVTISGFNRYNRAGEPVIPVKPVQILVPAGMKIETVTSKAIDTFQLPDTYRLSHGTKAFRKDVGPPETPTKQNPEIYSMTTFWPAKQHNLVTVQTNRGYNIAHVILFPLQYSPKVGKIKMATKMQLKIRFTSIDSPRGAKPTEALKKKLKRRLDNPDTMESYDEQAPMPPRKGAGDPLSDPGGPYYGENYDYIVVTNSSLAGISDQYSFQALCDSKAARGINAGIVTTDWILANYDGTRPDGGSDDQTRIRNFLIDAYETWGTEYALLAGDRNIIPPRLFYDYGDTFAADLYYGCVDPPDCTFDNDGDGDYGESNDGPGGGDVDLTAEIFTGRAAVEDEADVINFVRKTLVYETTDDPYLDYALSGGGYLGFGGIQEFNKPFSELIRLGSDLYLGHFTAGLESPSIPNARDFAANMTTLYDEDWYNDNHDPDYDYSGGVGYWDWYSDGWDATTELLPILNGTGGNTTPQMIYIADHGGATWGMVKLRPFPTSLNLYDSITNLTNTNPFFFYDDSCHVGNFSVANCFGEEITAGIEYGAFACILNSSYGWGAEGNTLDSPTTQLTREFFHSVLGEGIFELGIAHQEAKERCIWRLWYTRYDIYQSTLFGDPELRLRVTTPSCDYTCGDLDGDGGNVDADDVDLFNACWQKDILIYPDCICANLVEFGNHTIDSLDLAVLIELFLSSSSDYPPNDCSTSVTDPYPPSPAPNFATAPYATGKTSIKMVSTRATDFSGVEYYFACTAGGGHDSGWQDSRTYEDTALLPVTTYTYTVKARDMSDNYNETDASAGASATTFLYENLVLPANGGNLDSFTSEYGDGWFASDLTNGVTNEEGWSSEYNPAPYQEFIFSFRNGNSATLNEAVIHGGTGEGWYFSKDVEVWTSADGTSFTLVGSGTLLAQPNDSVTINLGDVVAKKVKLRVTSGYRTDYWELAEFEVYGAQPDLKEPLYMLADDVIDLDLHPGIANSLLAKIDTAIAKLEDGNTNNNVAAINSLEAFINAVEAQRGKKIPEADADALIATVLEIIELLST